MGAEQFEVHTVKPCDPKEVKGYEATLYEAFEEDGKKNKRLRTPNEAPCTAKAIVYNTFVLAGMIGHEIKKFVMNEFVAGLELRGDLRERVLMAI